MTTVPSSSSSRPHSPNSPHLSSSSQEPHRPRTVLPPLSSLSLPCSPLSPSIGFPSPPRPQLHHPRPTYPPLSAPPLLAPNPGAVPPAEVYARAYALLREKWAGCEGNIRQVADAASAALEAQQQRKRRSRSWEADVLEDGGDVDMAPASTTEEHKRAKLDEATSVAFFDNPAPVLLPPSSVTLTAEPEQYAASTRRHHSASPLPPSSTAIDAPPHHSHSSQHRPPLSARNRSWSLPSSPVAATCALPPPTHSLSSHTVPLAYSSAHTLPPSRSNPHLVHASRSQSLLHVVQSFETVLAGRAESWRRLAANGRVQ